MELNAYIKSPGGGPQCLTSWKKKSIKPPINTTVPVPKLKKNLPENSRLKLNWSSFVKSESFHFTRVKIFILPQLVIFSEFMKVVMFFEMIQISNFTLKL